MMLFADTTRNKNYAKDPAVVYFSGQYIMYYSVPPFGDGRSHDGWGIAYAVSPDLLNWQRKGEILRLSALEKNGFCAPGALVIRDQVHLFYQTYGNGANDAICHAVSDDGFNFTANPTNPIFSAEGDWSSGRAIDADVIIFNDRLFLYAATRDPKQEIQMLTGAYAPLASDFSRDNWTQFPGESILKPELDWEQKCIEAPATCLHNGKIFLFYAGAYNNCPQQIGCAVSNDGIHFRRISDQPLLPNGKPGEWNHSESGHPFVFTDHNGRQYLFFQGNNDNGKTWYLSQKEIHWHADTPCF